MEGELWPAFAEMVGLYWNFESIGRTCLHVYGVQWTDCEHPINEDIALSASHPGT